MRELVERIDRLAAAASERPWQTVALVAESICRADREFVAELVNAWPQIRAALLGEAQP